jgi:hypothetical protein
VKGLGNQQDYGMRIYDPRIGRFLSVDPLTKSYPWYTPYQFAGNKPIWAVDLDGMEEWQTNNGSGETVRGPLNPEYAASQGLTMKGDKKQFKAPLKNENLDFEWHEPWEKKGRYCTNCNEVLNDKLPNGKDVEISIDAISMNDPSPSIGEAKGGSGLIPIYGSGRNAINDFQNGQYVKGAFNGALAISDLFLVKSIVQGGVQGGFKALTLGNAPWSKRPWQTIDAYRDTYIESGFMSSTDRGHHWLIQQNGSVGKYVPESIKNQMFNIKVFPNQQLHMVYGHGQNYLGMQGANFLQRAWYGTPAWPKLFILSYGGRGVQLGMGNGNSNNTGSK